MLLLTPVGTFAKNLLIPKKNPLTEKFYFKLLKNLIVSTTSKIIKQGDKQRNKYSFQNEAFIKHL